MHLSKIHRKYIFVKINLFLTMMIVFWKKKRLMTRLGKFHNGIWSRLRGSIYTIIFTNLDFQKFSIKSKQERFFCRKPDQIEQMKNEMIVFHVLFIRKDELDKILFLILLKILSLTVSLLNVHEWLNWIFYKHFLFEGSDGLSKSK